MAKSFELGLGASFLRDICLSGMLYCEKAGVALRFDELLVKEVLAVVAAVSDLFFGGLGVSVILLSVVWTYGGACPFLLEAQLGVMLVVKRWTTSFFF
jgi:hypothetical protein